MEKVLVRSDLVKIISNSGYCPSGDHCTGNDCDECASAALYKYENSSTNNLDDKLIKLSNDEKVTNREVIQKMYPDKKFSYFTNMDNGRIMVRDLDNTMEFDLDFWSSNYNK